jgi:hypothetical protein
MSYPKGPKFPKEVGNNMVMLGVMWFKQVGIVLVQDKITREYKFYISEVPLTKTEIEDAEYVAKYGTHFPFDAGRMLYEGFSNFDFSSDYIKENPHLFI